MLTPEQIDRIVGKCLAIWPECFARILELRKTDVLSTRQAADEAGVTTQDIVRWISSGKLLAAKRDGRYTVPRNDLDLVKARRRREAADRASKGVSNVDTRTD